WKVLSKAANGNSAFNLNYSLTDEGVKPGVYYYRLSQTDIDGTTKVSGLIAVTVKPDRDVMSVKPNPSAGTAEVTYDCSSEETALLKIYDHAGNVIMSKEISCSKGQNKYFVDIAD